jgi:predicted SprT family Zn-dependent metalloprotease
MQPGKPHAVSYGTTDQPTITEREYGAFQHAYDFFNAELFGNSLPHVLVTLQRHARAKGYFAPDRFAGRVENDTAHELALNPDVFTGRSDELILSTLVHEMAHVWQQTHGTAPRRSYPDKEWVAKMKKIRFAAHDHGRARRQGNRPKRDALPHSRRRIRAGLRQTRRRRVLSQSAVRLVRWWGEPQEEDSEQNEVHLPHVRHERLGEASNETDLRWFATKRMAEKLRCSNQRPAPKTSREAA